MRRYWRQPRPFYRSVIDAAFFLIVLTIVLAAMKQFGWIDLGVGSLQVVDGDSLRRGGTEIRLHGIDAPEYRQTCRDKHGAEYPCGKQAANALRSLVREGEVSCTSIETDRYGRAVAVCKRGELDINAEMVRLGWAVAYSSRGATSLIHKLAIPPLASLRMPPRTRHSQAHFVPLPCTTRDVKGALSSICC